MQHHTLKYKFILIALLVVFVIMSLATWGNLFETNQLFSAFLSFIFITVIFWFAVTRLIDQPINRIVKAIKKIEEGDLSVKIRTEGNDEFGQLAESLNRMVESLELARNEVETCHNEQIRRAAKLASLGEMASAIAHEIKNPLAGISSAVQVLLSELDAEDPKKRIMNEVLNQVKRLDRAVRDLLTYAKPVIPKMSNKDINAILEKTLFFIQQVAKKWKAHMTTDLDQYLPQILVDADQMQQVFINICINAIQAMPDGGDLSIATMLVQPEKPDETLPEDLNKNSEWVKINFKDHGIGIPPDDADKIFDPFFTKKGKGTGLGLSISQRIIEEHGGRITFSTEIGKGSVFSVYLPVKR
jgi:signal transduction histidine kinase